MHHDTQLQRLAENAGRLGKIGIVLKRWRWFALFVIAPSLIATVYYGLIASDIYISESRFVIKSPGGKSSSISSLAGLIQTTGMSAGREQTSEIIDYLRSRDALSDLAKRVNVREVYMSDLADRLSRYPAPMWDDNFENLYKYYGSMVDIQVDGETGMAVLTTKAFDPQQAQVLNQNLLGLSEGLVNRLNQRVHSKSITEAEGHVKVAEARVQAARAALSQYRNTSELLDPAQQGMSALAVSNELTVQQSELRGKLSAIESAAPNHPAIPAMRQRLAELSRQIAAQTGRAVGTPSGIASKLGTYEALAVEQEFATQMLTAANAALEQARAEALKQEFYLERVVEANKPDDALYPARIKQILTIVFGSLCLYLVGWMLVVGILEHAPED